MGIIANHRCKASLAAQTSIHFEVYLPGDQAAWWLIHNTIDWEWDVNTQEYVAKINYCPFCGKKLPIGGTEDA